MIPDTLAFELSILYESYNPFFIGESGSFGSVLSLMNCTIAGSILLNQFGGEGLLMCHFLDLFFFSSTEYVTASFVTITKKLSSSRVLSLVKTKIRSCPSTLMISLNCCILWFWQVGLDKPIKFTKKAGVSPGP